MENSLRFKHETSASHWLNYTWEDGELNLYIKFKDSAIITWKFMFGTPENILPVNFTEKVFTTI